MLLNQRSDNHPTFDLLHRDLNGSSRLEPVNRHDNPDDPAINANDQIAIKQPIGGDRRGRESEDESDTDRDKGHGEVECKSGWRSGCDNIQFVLVYREGGQIAKPRHPDR